MDHSLLSVLSSPLGLYVPLCRFKNRAERFEEWGERIDFIVDPVDRLPSPDDPKIKQILELSLGWLQAETRLIHDLSLIKSLARLGNEQLKDSGPCNRTKESGQNLVRF